MSSSSVSIVTVSTGLVFSTLMLKTTSAPGSGTLVGAASLVSSMLEGVSVSSTVSSSLAVVTLSSSSSAVAVTMSVWVSKALPMKVASKAQA